MAKGPVGKPSIPSLWEGAVQDNTPPGMKKWDYLMSRLPPKVQRRARRKIVIKGRLNG